MRTKIENDWFWEDWALDQIRRNVAYHSIVLYLNNNYRDRPADRGYDIHDVVQWAGRAQKRQSYYPLSKPADVLEFKRKSVE